MTKKRWKLASAYVIGRGHCSKNLPCQDRTFELVKNHSTGTFYGLALADGAGSCKYSDVGAEIITEKILFFIKSNFSLLFKSNKISEDLLRYVDIVLNNVALEQNIEIKDLSSTLLFVALKEDKFIIGHIGDGVIGMLNKDNILHVLSHPENGEFSNSTYFTTSYNHPYRMRVKKGTIQNSIGFILMSDGSANSLYDMQYKKLAEINIDIINWLEKENSKIVSKALFENLENIIKKKTLDDCSLGVMRCVSINK